MAESSAGLCACGKPGCSDGSDQVAPVREGFVPDTLAMVTARNRKTPWLAVWTGRTWREADGFGGFCVDVPLSIRPVLVIDPEDRSAWRDLVQRSEIHTPGQLIDKTVDRLMSAARSLLTPPTRIPECPEGCTVVVDKDDDAWSRDGDVWLCDSAEEELAWPDLWAKYGPLRSVGPIIGSGSAGIGEAE